MYNNNNREETAVDVLQSGIVDETTCYIPRFNRIRVILCFFLAAFRLLPIGIVLQEKYKFFSLHRTQTSRIVLTCEVIINLGPSLIR